MKLLIASPTKAYLLEYTDEEFQTLTKKLTYTNTAVQHLIKRHHNNYNWKQRGFDGWNNHLESLKKDLKPCLVFQEGDRYYIRPGSIPYIADCFTGLEMENNIVYPTIQKMAWKHPPKFNLYPYQEESWINLLKQKHGHVSITTGGGKSSIILKLCRETGFNAAVVAPSKSIFYELLENFEHHLGKSNVGTFGDSKKKIGKKITICIGDSLCNIKPDTPEYEFFSNLQAIHTDESHIWGSDSLEQVCHGLFANVPYRWFYSGTQVRGDGAQSLLDSIIGKRVYELTTEQAVTGGFISPHKFNIVEIDSSSPSFQCNGGLEMKREHVLRNKNICDFIVKFTNAIVAAKKEQVLILVEELQQIADLVKRLTVPYAIAHSETKPARLLELGLEKVDPLESIEKFNKGDAKVLIGTATIRTGCNIYPVNHCINWVGGSSEVATRQGCVGRSVRLAKHNPWSNKCGLKPFSTIWDFDVKDIYIMGSHLEKRIQFYQESGPDLIKYIRLKS